MITLAGNLLLQECIYTADLDKKTSNMVSMRVSAPDRMMASIYTETLKEVWGEGTSQWKRF